VRRLRSDFEKRRTRIQQGINALAWQQLAALKMLGTGLVTAAQGNALQLETEVGHQFAHVALVFGKVAAPSVKSPLRVSS